MSYRNTLTFILALAFALLLSRIASADERTAETRRMLDLLLGTRLAYGEAFEDGGEELDAPLELEEARMLLAEARGLNDRLHLVPTDAMADLSNALDSKIGKTSVPEQLKGLMADITRQTGVTIEILPPAAPSAVRGRDLYKGNCTGCHGANGGGDGPDAAQTAAPPADFTNVVYMRRETPLDFFRMVSIGRRRFGMPDWSQGFSVQQRWDVVAYVWGLQRTDADRVEGKQLWGSRCASCHGAVGAGVPGAAHDLTRPGSLIDRPDRTLFVGLFRAPHQDTIAGLSDEQRWRLVGQVRALSLGGGEPGALASRSRSARPTASGSAR